MTQSSTSFWLYLHILLEKVSIFLLHLHATNSPLMPTASACGALDWPIQHDWCFCHFVNQILHKEGNGFVGCCFPMTIHLYMKDGCGDNSPRLARATTSSLTIVFPFITKLKKRATSELWRFRLIFLLLPVCKHSLKRSILWSSCRSQPGDWQTRSRSYPESHNFRDHL